MSKLAAFLGGVGYDGRGRTIKDYMTFLSIQRETEHDYIQWAFPSPIPSQSEYNTAPVLTEYDLAMIKTDRRAVDNFSQFLDSMLNWYGQTDHWTKEHDHNHRRITRIIIATRLILGQDKATLVYRKFCDYNHACGDKINQESLQFWRNACFDPISFEKEKRMLSAHESLAVTTLTGAIMARLMEDGVVPSTVSDDVVTAYRCSIQLAIRDAMDWAKIDINQKV